MPAPSLTRLLLFVALLTLAGTTCARRSSSGQPTAYVGATVFDGTDATARREMVVVTRADRIEAVVPLGDFRPVSGMATVNLRGKFLIPGLINTHVHLATTARPAAARGYLRREIYSGVTAVRDMACDARLLAELKREAEFDEIESPDIFYAALMAGPPFFVDPRTRQASRGREPGSAPWMQAIDEQTNLPLVVAMAKGSGATAIKVYADVSPTLLAALSDEAHHQGLLVWAHATIFPARPSDAVNDGVDVLSHACMLGYEVTDPLPAVLTHPPLRVDTQALAEPDARVDRLLAGMKDRGTILDATLHVYFADDSGVECSYATSAKLAGAAYRAGVALSAGTDDEPGDHPGTYSALLDELALLQGGAGLTPADALHAATLNGARAIGREADMGSVEVGKLANFVVLDKDPLTDPRPLRRVSMTVKNGIVFRRSAYALAGVHERSAATGRPPKPYDALAK